MATELKSNNFAKFAWFALGYNILVILWGVFLRASKSGDGCGMHWLTCHGEVIPSAPELKTIIEFSHRVTSGIAFFVVLALVIWAFRKFPKGEKIRKLAFASFIFIITEALVGAGLVLTGNTAGADTPWRPFWAAGHLINTFILLALLSLTAWAASGVPTAFRDVSRKTLLPYILGTFGILLIGLSGSMAALSSMLYPSESLAEGIAKDFADSSQLILRLRILHPLLGVAVSLFLAFIAAKAIRSSAGPPRRFAKYLIGLLAAQLVFGLLTLLTLAPILMQVGHLLLADAIWIVFVLMAASHLSSEEGEIH